MSESSPPPAPGRWLPILLILFAGSGCSALIYEIVWFQMLQLVIGSSAVSIGVLLGTFMGGMCLGSVAFPRLVSNRWHPLWIYGMLELAIGLIGIAVLFGMPLVDGVYVSAVGRGLPGILLRGLVASVCLLPPTVLMGATLPAIARWIETSPRGVAWLGFLYGGNIAGAVLGCLLAGFYLLRVYDMATATAAAVALNVVVMLVSFVLAALTAYQAPAVERAPKSAAVEPGAWTIHVALALSGATALAAEVVWTRLLSLLLGGTVYTFSIILAVFLVGLGIGSSVGSIVGRQTIRPRIALAVCQWLLAAAIAWTAYALTQSLPYWPVSPYMSQDTWINFQLDLARCCWGILPATCLWGASFPLAVAAAARRGQDPGRLVGGLYSANTLGAIAGALAASLFLVKGLGTQDTQRVLIGLAALSALIALAPPLWEFCRRPASLRFALPLRIGFVLLLLPALVAPVIALADSVAPVPWALVAFGRCMANDKDPSKDVYYTKWGNDSITVEDVYVGEGMNSSVAVTRLANGVRQFHVAGKVEASSDPMDMRLQRMLGHIPALVHPRPRSVLVVGCGAGVTAGTFVVHPEVERIVICEIEPLVPQVVAQHFKEENHDVVHDPRVQIVYDDARHYILTTDEKFDIITSDPIHPWVKGSAALYTAEYFELCKRHLNPGGVVTQWVPLYESKLEVVQSELATFFEVFPGGTVWSSDTYGYDTVVMGQAEPTRIDVDAIQERLSRKDHEAVAKSLDEVEFHNAQQLFLTYAGQAADLKTWLKDAQINRDRNLRLQYLAGLSLNIHDAEAIQKEILQQRRSPEELFVGPGRLSRALRFKFSLPL